MSVFANRSQEAQEVLWRPEEQASGAWTSVQKIAASSPKFGVATLVTALDYVGSGTRRSGRFYMFPSRRNPKLRQAGSTPKNSSLAPQPSLECWCLRSLWIGWAREHALLADPTSSPLIGNSWGGGIREYCRVYVSENFLWLFVRLAIDQS